MPNLLENINELMGLSKDELTEVLLDEKYNKANLREQLRRSISTANEYKRAFEYQKQLNEKERKEQLFASLHVLQTFVGRELGMTSDEIQEELEKMQWRNDD